MPRRSILIAAAVCCFALTRGWSQPAAAPHLENRGKVTQLIVDNRPFLILGGELFNNSATSLQYMKPLWPKLAAMHLNTVLAPISWALLEPAEGHFDFTLPDGLIQDARAHNLRLIFLWFGSWKNSWSSYTPDWVKRDYERFPRVRLRNGTGTERLSPFSDANLKADSRAFAALMRRIKQVDATARTVIMVQVENEVGMIPDARDHSDAANTAYSQAVPKELLDYLLRHKDTLHPALRSRIQKEGNWEAVFGTGPETDDLFMAWHFAKYIGQVAGAGKAEYNLPMFANAALIRPNYAAGQYNSGGPLPHSAAIWKVGAPQLDLIAPDIYFEFKTWSERYAQPGNPLFIPEAAGSAQSAANVFYAVGALNAIGFSPFAVDSMDLSNEGGKELARSYDALAQLTPLIEENQPKGNVAGILLEDLTPSQRIELGDYTLTASAAAPPRLFPGEPAGPAAPRSHSPAGIFIATAPDEFYMAGSGLNITFSPRTPGPPQAGLATVEEGRFVEGRWMKGRTLAGDDTGQGNNISLRNTGDMPILHVKVYRYR